jgi:hypothetical protein
MSRKHYVAMAESLRFARPPRGEESPAPSPAVAQWQADVRAVADVFAADNGRFQRERFYRAAGLDA